MKETPSLLILCAMPQELKGICRMVKNVKKHHAGLYSATSSSGRQIILAYSGLGGVNAACAVTELSCRYSLAALVLLGVGGALESSREVGDLVVAEKILQHDSCAFFDMGRFLVRPGQSLRSGADGLGHDPCLYPDETLSSLCLGVVGLRSCRGCVVTGAEFSGTRERKMELAKLVSGVGLIEMEAGGFAQVAGRLQLPYAVAKSIADRFDPADETIIADFHASFESAIRSAALVARHLQEKW
ncbi:5'-methylthioadenosine/S-adenosylhomocysteine nucleosidase family protein [Desulfotalea psychrophila]|nr:5'-methylthioadenosine/S-adenosylhomocysteine nucleosidase [Desulfotalea psychrophila]